MGVMFEGNQVLFDGNAVAMHEDCCCTEHSDYDCDCFAAGETPVYGSLTAVGITGSSSVLNGTFVLEQNQYDYCRWTYQWGTYPNEKTWMVDLDHGPDNDETYVFGQGGVPGFENYTIPADAPPDCTNDDSASNAHTSAGGTATWSIIS